MLTSLIRLARSVLALLALAVTFLLTLLIAPALAADGTVGETVRETTVWTDSAQWLILAGVLTPLVTSIAQQPRWTGTVRTIVGMVAAVVVGVLTLLANGTLDNVLNSGASTWLSLLALVVGASAAAYKTIWQPIGLAPKIENATSKTPPAAPDPGPTPPAGGYRA